MIDLRAIADFCEGLTLEQLERFGKLSLEQQHELATAGKLSREHRHDAGERGLFA